MTRVPPHSAEAEAGVLGICMLNEAVVPSVLARLDDRCFYLEKNRVIYRALRSASEKGYEIDPISVGCELSQADKTAIGGVVYLSTLTDNVVPSGPIDAYMRKLVELRNVREVIQRAQSIIEEGFTPDEGYIRRSISSLASVTAVDESGFRSVADLSGEFVEEVDNGVVPSGVVNTGIAAYDSKIGGIWPGIVTMLAARPSMGKSALALNIMVNAAMAGRKVIFFSLEDTAPIVTMRIYSRFTKIDMNILKMRNFTSLDIERIHAQRPIVDSLPLEIDDSTGYDVDKIYAKIIASDAELVVIDHFLKIKNKGGGSLYDQLTNKSSELTACLKEANRANLVLHQLSRANTGRDNKRPQLTDLRGTGEIEQDIRACIFLHRPSYYDMAGGDDGRAELIVAKNSHGPTGLIDINCDLSTMRFW